MTQTVYPESAAPVPSSKSGAPTTRKPDVQLDLTRSPTELIHPGRLERERPRGLVNVATMLLLPAALMGTGVAVVSVRGNGSDQKMAQLLVERDQAQKDAALTKKQLEDAVAERRAIEAQRDEALAGEKAARRGEQDTKNVLAFLKDKILLATGNPASWESNGLGKQATLRDAVEAAEAKTLGTFGDQPLVEASIREILGAAYLDLGDAERAVQQYQRALALREAELGRDDASAGDCRNQLAIAYRRANRHDDASRLFDVHPHNGRRGNRNDR